VDFSLKTNLRAVVRRSHMGSTANPPIDPLPGGGTESPVNNQVLKALIDAIVSLPPYYRAVLLMGFILFMTFLGLIRTHPDDAYRAFLLIVVLFIVALIRKPPPSDPALSEGQKKRAELILPDSSQLTARSN
jgi:hypothetical protein